MTESLTVGGGATGVLARVADMRATADVLDTKGDVARSLATQVAEVAVHDAVLGSQVLSPVTGARVLGEVAQAQLPPEGLIWVALEYEAAAVFLRGAATAYEETDAALARLAELRDTATGVVLVNAGLLGAGGIALTSLLLDVLPDPMADALTPDAFAAWIDEVGEDPAGAVLAELYDHPWATDSIISGLPWVLGTQVPLVLGALTPWTFTSVPLTYEQVVAAVIAGGGLLGLLADGTPVVTPEPHDPRYPTPESWQAALDATAADSLSALFDNISGLGDGATSEVRVTAVPDGAGGHTWIVEIPGTQDWAAESGSNPSNLATNLHLMAGSHATAMEQGVLEALAQARAELAASTGVPLSELAAQPVTLAGHSQGGIVAASLAADPGNGLNVTTVVTGGSPVANMAVPDSVTVISLEHAQDPVHHLDGNPNPAGPNWTTVVRDVDGHSHVTAGDPFSAHHGSLYAETGALVDEQAAHDPALQLALGPLQEQFSHVRGGEAHVFQFDIAQEHR
ncbi:hypothetical protein FHE66_05275 [Georgenia sp. 311]|uniref:Alpha/beta hydrolase n=1 Tax=Georgenia wutianyii TaxID=2585135 RepID=A0ABX5VIR7_9MICO|nr:MULTISPECIES: hypothetical protein [Georgenia]QDB78257.1 hypothetical protein FE251_01855 [Georgenia wutianyii]TNC18793.1 hypothetical protein FHE66_05275 [Georgenia sp. 311]